MRLRELTDIELQCRLTAPKGLLWLRLLDTETTGPAEASRLPLKGRAARAVMGWIVETQIDDRPLFRPISKSGRPLPRRLAPEALRHILQHRLDLAGLPPGYASPHGLSDPSRARRCATRRRDEAQPAPLGASVPTLLRRSVDHRQDLPGGPGHRQDCLRGLSTTGKAVRISVARS